MERWITQLTNTCGSKRRAKRVQTAITAGAQKLKQTKSTHRNRADCLILNYRQWQQLVCCLFKSRLLFCQTLPVTWICSQPFIRQSFQDFRAALWLLWSKTHMHTKLQHCKWTHQLTGHEINLVEVDMLATLWFVCMKPSENRHTHTYRGAHTHSFTPSLMRETKRRQLTWLSAKPRARKYIQIMQNAKKRYCFQSEHVLERHTLASPAIKNSMQKCFITKPPKYAKPSGKETDSG